jgi:ribosome-binding protein aMBF1 (putative translation factor)
MKITPAQALAELAHLPHDQPLRRPASNEQLPPAITSPAEIDGLFEEVMVLANLKQLLANARQRRGLSLRQAATSAGMKHPQLAQIEQSDGRVELRTLARLAQALDFELHLSLVPKHPGTDGPTLAVKLTTD